MWLQQVPDAPLLFVDFIVNDSFEEKDAARLSSAYEAFIRQAKALRPDLEIVFVNTCSLVMCEFVVNVVKTVADFYGVPVISYHNLVREVIARSPSARPEDLHEAFWGPPRHTHPTWQVHQLMADTVSACFLEAWRRFCPLAADEWLGAGVVGAGDIEALNLGRSVPLAFLEASLPWSLPASTLSEPSSLAAYETAQHLPPTTPP
jgi:hypothetical protein